MVIGALQEDQRHFYSVITALPSDIGVPVLVVQHMPVGFTKAFAERLDRASNLKVVEAEDKMPIEKNVVYIAKAGYHMEVENNRIVLKETPAIWGVKASSRQIIYFCIKGLW